jgi:hypothetical protein
MRVILRFLREYLAEHFQWKLYAGFFVIVGVFIGFNYAIDFEDSYIDRQHFLMRMVLFFLLHALSYYAIVLWVAWQTGRREALRKRDFWIKSGLGLLALCALRSFPYYELISQWTPREITIFVMRIAKYTLGWTVATLPLLLLYLVYDRRSGDGFYGLKFKRVDFKPYAAMLLVVIPLALAASFTESFLKDYPRYIPTHGQRFAEFFSLPEWSALLTFEITYLSSFLFVEFFFRGFLIVGLDKYLRADVVLPMAATYAVFHFGKPLGETISSIFGGYLLGIFALKGRNIWGGVFIHMGVAFFMDLFAYLQRYVL